MSEDVTIRAATADDVQLVLSFVKELAEYERLSHAVVATEADIRASLFGPRPYAECVFACLANQPVGFALFFHNYSTFLGQPGLYLEDLFVRPSVRGKGVGRKLLVYLAQLAVERGCGRLEWAVLNWNEPAIRFYENLGARANSEWTGYRLAGDALARLSKENPACMAG
jgi:GNAT superfamily N-acetyltransferase